MTKQQKEDLIGKLSDEFANSNALLVCDYKGTTHKELEELRVMAQESGVKIQIAKNTLVNIAMENAKFETLALSGTNLFAWSDDQISVCKIVDKFASSHKDTFSIKSGIVESKIVTLDTINALAKLPSRDELIGMLLSVWTAPARNFVTGLDNLRDKKETAA
jgi:large subunit ribosomal protein L10